MAKKKVKTVAPPASSVEATQTTDTVAVLDVEPAKHAPSVSVTATESNPKKTTRAAKKTATVQLVTPVAEEPVESSTQKQPCSTKRTTKAQVIAPIAEESTSTDKKSLKDKEKDQTSDKVKKIKRLTLDIPKPLHKAIKAQAVEEGISIVDMLRTLLEKHYGK